MINFIYFYFFINALIFDLWSIIIIYINVNFVYFKKKFLIILNCMVLARSKPFTSERRRGFLGGERESREISGSATQISRNQQ